MAHYVEYDAVPLVYIERFLQEERLLLSLHVTVTTARIDDPTPRSMGVKEPIVSFSRSVATDRAPGIKVVVGLDVDRSAEVCLLAHASHPVIR